MELHNCLILYLFLFELLIVTSTSFRNCFLVFRIFIADKTFSVSLVGSLPPNDIKTLSKFFLGFTLFFLRLENSFLNNAYFGPNNLIHYLGTNLLYLVFKFSS